MRPVAQVRGQGLAMGGVGRGRGNRTVLLPQTSGPRHLPPTPVPNDQVFQGVFARHATQAPGSREDQTAVRAADSSSSQADMVTPFGRGSTPLMGPARGQAVPMSTGLQPGGLQQAQATTPRDRPILEWPRAPAQSSQPQDTDMSRLVYEPDGQIIYYGPDASNVFQRTYQMNWARSWHDTRRQQ